MKIPQYEWEYHHFTSFYHMFVGLFRIFFCWSGLISSAPRMISIDIQDAHDIRLPRSPSESATAVQSWGIPSACWQSICVHVCICLHIYIILYTVNISKYIYIYIYRINMCVLYNIYVQYIYIYEQLYTVSAKQSLHVCMYIYIYVNGR